MSTGSPSCCSIHGVGESILAGCDTYEEQYMKVKEAIEDKRDEYEIKSE